MLVTVQDLLPYCPRQSQLYVACKTAAALLFGRIKDKERDATMPGVTSDSAGVIDRPLLLMSCTGPGRQIVCLVFFSIYLPSPEWMLFGA